MHDRRRPPTSRDVAEAMFKTVTAKPAEMPAAKPSIPGTREQVTLRIDQAVLDRFREGGPGWQDRINDALKKLTGL